MVMRRQQLQLRSRKLTQYSTLLVEQVLAWGLVPGRARARARAFQRSEPRGRWQRLQSSET